MDVTFNLPDLGEGLTEAEILEWKVAEGDVVRLDQEIVEVSTAKAVVVIPSPHAGTVATLHAAAGEVLEVGSPLITFSVDGPEEATTPTDADEEATTPTDADEGAAEPDGPAEPDEPDEPDDDRSPNLVGYGAATDKVGRRRRRSPHGGPESATPARRPLTKPPVRKLAKELGVDLTTVTPSGDGGVITRDDVLGAADGPATTAGTERAPATSSTPGGELIPIRGVRRNIAERMEASGAIPAAAAWQETRATGLMSLAAELREADPDARITPFAVVLRVVVAALREVPALNAHYTADGIRRFDEVHLGFAAATDRGLLVPVIRDAHTRSVAELNAELRRLSDEARDGTITPTDLIGSTFTVTNFGALGMDGGIPLINAPEVGIMGIGVIEDRPTVTKKGKVKAVPSTQVTLSFDHRVADGAEAAAFLRFVTERLASKGKLLGML